MKKLVCLFLMLCLMAGCTHTSRNPQLVAVDSMLLSQPDSALSQLRQLLPSFGGTEGGFSFGGNEGGASTADRMYYYLLLADACNKCYDTLPSDSIMHQVADFYDAHGTANEQVRAHYLLGCTYRDMGEAPQALDCYHTAIDRADTTSEDCNYRLLSRVHAQTAGLFKEQYMPEEAINELNNAIRYSEKANDIQAALYCYENKLGTFYQAGLYDSVLVHTIIIHNKYRIQGFHDRAASCLSPAIFVLIQRHQLEEAKQYINIYERYSKRDGNTSNKQAMYYTYLGYYYLYSNCLDSALSYFKQQLIYKERINNRVLAYHGLFETYQKVNQKDSALKYAKMYNEANDSSNIFESANTLQRMQAMYRYERNLKRTTISEYEAKKSRLRMWAAIGTGFVLLLIVIYHYRRIRLKERQRLTSLNQKYNDTLELLEIANGDLKMIQKENVALIQKKEKEIENYKKLLVLYEPNAFIPENNDDFFVNNPLLKTLHKKASGGKPASDSNMCEVLEMINDNFPTFLSDIEKNVGKLTYKQTSVCILTKLYFIPSEIGTLLQMRYQAVSNMRSRLAKALLGPTATPTDLDTMLHTLK